MGENKERLELLLTKKIGLPVRLEIRDVKKPDLNAKIV